MSGKDDTEDEPLGAIHALIALAARDGLGEPLTWDEILPLLLSIARDPVGPRNCRRLFARVNDPAVLATLEDWFERAAAERDDAAKKTERAATMITLPVQRGGVGLACGIGLAMAIGTLSGGAGLALMCSAAAVAGGGTVAGWKQATQADSQHALARDFRRLEAIAKESREFPPPG